MKNNYKQNYDVDTDIFWVIFKDGAEESYEEIAPGINVEFNDKKEIIGIEIQNFQRLYVFKSNATKSIENYFTTSYDSPICQTPVYNTTNNGIITV